MQNEVHLRLIEINLRCEDITNGSPAKETILLAFMGRVEIRVIEVFICSFIYSTHILGWQGLGGKEKGELLLKRCNVSVLRMKRVLGMNGDGCTTVGMYLITLSYTLKNS